MNAQQATSRDLNLASTPYHQSDARVDITAPRTATIVVQLDTSDAPMTEDQARGALGEVVDALSSVTYVSSAFLMVN